MWKKYIQTLLPAPSRHPSLLGMHLQKVWAEWQPTAPKGAGTVICLPFSTPCMPFPLDWLWGMISILVSGFALLNLQKKKLKKSGGAYCGLTWCAFTHNGLMCLLGSRRHQISASAGPKERTRWCVPKRWGESSIVPAGSSMLLKWVRSSHQTTFAGSMLPSSAAGGKCS